MNHDEDVLCGWTIYHRPLDYPNHWAVRMWWVDGEGQVVKYPVAGLYDTLEEAREGVPVGCICFPRDLDDDPVIYETWM